MRRILIVPSVSTTSVSESESFQELYRLTEVVSRFRNNVFFYMVVPPWIKDGLKGHDRIHYVHVETTRDVAINDIVGYSAYDIGMWFARRGGRHIIDAVITDCVQFSLQLSRVISDPSKKSVPVFVRDLRRMHSKKRMSRLEEFSLAMNLCVGNVGVVSEASQKNISSFMSKHVVPIDVKVFNDNSFVWRESSDLEYLHGCVERAERGKEVSIFVGGNPDYNGGRKILSICRNLYAIGCTVKLSSMASHSKVTSLIPDKDISYIEDIKTKLPRDAYYIDMARSHFFISAGQTERSFKEELERIVVGQVGIFPHVDHVISVLGSDYPFYYNANEWSEAYEMAEWVFENYDSAAMEMGPYVSIAEKSLSLTENIMSAWRRMEYIISGQYVKHKMNSKAGKSLLFSDVYQVASGLGVSFAGEVFLDVLEEKVPYLKPWSRKGTLMSFGNVREPLPTMFDLRMMLDNLGWIDRCDGYKIVFERERDPLEGVLTDEQD